MISYSINALFVNALEHEKTELRFPDLVIINTYASFFSLAVEPHCVVWLLHIL